MAYPPLYLLIGPGWRLSCNHGYPSKVTTDDKCKDPGATWALKVSGFRELSPQTRIPVASPSVHHCAPTDPLPHSYPGVWSRSGSLLVGLLEFTGCYGGPVARDFGTDWRMGKKFCTSWPCSTVPNQNSQITMSQQFNRPKEAISHRLEKRAEVAAVSVPFRLVACRSCLLMKQLRGVCPCQSSCVRKRTMIHEPEWTQVARLHKESHVRSLHPRSIHPCTAAVESLLSPFFDFASASCLQSPRSPPGIDMGVGEVGESTDSHDSRI